MPTSTRRLVIAIAFALLGGLAFTAESSLLGMTVPSGGTDLARASAVPSAAVPARTDRSNPPNIVLILSDDQRADTLAAMPNVRELLAARGTTFENAFVSNSLCCPSRTTILTGSYSHLTGVYGNRAPYGGFRSFRDSSTLATWLDDAGYETALVGKYLNDYETSYVPPGRDDWVAFAGDPGYYNYRLNVNGDLRRFGRRPEHYSTTTLAGYATRFVRKAKRPFFLMFAPYAPHAPAVAPPTGPRRETVAAPLASPASRELDVSDKPDHIRALTPLSRRERRRTESFRGRQLRAIGGVDSAVGRIVHALEDTGQLDNTLVIFTSDNGVSWGEHRLGAERKLVPYEGAIHVPLVMRYDPLTPDAENRDAPDAECRLRSNDCEARRRRDPPRRGEEPPPSAPRRRYSGLEKRLPARAPCTGDEPFDARKCPDVLRREVHDTCIRPLPDGRGGALRSTNRSQRAAKPRSGTRCSPDSRSAALQDTRALRPAAARIRSGDPVHDPRDGRS